MPNASARSANSFDELYNELQKDLTYIDQLLIDSLQSRMESVQPKLVAISVPFRVTSMHHCAAGSGSKRLSPV